MNKPKGRYAHKQYWSKVLNKLEQVVLFKVKVSSSRVLSASELPRAVVIIALPVRMVHIRNKRNYRYELGVCDTKNSRLNNQKRHFNLQH